MLFKAAGAVDFTPVDEVQHSLVEALELEEKAVTPLLKVRKIFF